MGMRILKTYVIREYLKPFLLGLSVFAFILFMGNMTQLVKMVFTHRVEAIVALKLLLYLIPFIASYSFPMAVLLSVLLAYSRLSSDNEIVAVKASGINPASLILPCVLLSLLLSLLCVKLNDTILPRATYATRELIAGVGIKKPSMFFPQRSLIENFPGHILYIQKVKGSRLYGIHISHIREKGQPASIVAQEGEILVDRDREIITLKLVHGTIDEVDEKEPYRYHRSSFNKYYLDLPLPAQTRAAVSKRPKDMTIRELQEKVVELRQKKMNPSPLLTEINRKLSLAFASLSFALIAAPLGLRAKRGGGSSGFGLSLLLIIIYYILFTACQILGEKGVVPPTLIWTPNIALAAVGCFLIWRTK